MNEINDPASQADELSVLKARADQMGLAYHPSIKVEKLREKINGFLSGTPVNEGNAPAAAPAAKTEDQIRQEHIDNASRLVRIRVTCMNPNKASWPGEIFTVGNSVVGSFSKFVPFNADVGWHVPHIIYEHIQVREFQTFVTKRDARGNETRRGKLVKEFAVELLPPLTPAELKDLAQQQAMANSVD